MLITTLGHGRGLNFSLGGESPSVGADTDPNYTSSRSLERCSPSGPFLDDTFPSIQGALGPPVKSPSSPPPNPHALCPSPGPASQSPQSQPTPPSVPTGSSEEGIQSSPKRGALGFLPGGRHGLDIGVFFPAVCSSRELPVARGPRGTQRLDPKPWSRPQEPVAERGPRAGRAGTYRKG